MSSSYMQDGDDDDDEIRVVPHARKPRQPGGGAFDVGVGVDNRGRSNKPTVGSRSRGSYSHGEIVLGSSSRAPSLTPSIPDTITTGTGSRAFLSRLESSASTSESNTLSRAPESIGYEQDPTYGDGFRYGLGGYGDGDIGSQSGASGGVKTVPRAGARARMLGDEMEEDDEDSLDDVQKLIKVWTKERGTPGLVGWEGDLIDSIFDKLEQQGKMVDTLRSDPSTSEEEHFRLLLVQTEMERVKYLIRSYVRTRLWKIEKFSHYIVTTPEVHDLLSGGELTHARRYTELLHSHYQHSVLDSLPEWLRKMDDSYGDGMSMISKPNLNTPVLIYCRKDCGEVTLEDGEGAVLGPGTTHLVKYKLVDRWIQLGWAEVL